MSSVQPFDKPSRAFCVLCREERESEVTAKNITSIEETIKLQIEKSNQEENKLKSNDFLSILQELKLETLCNSFCADVQQKRQFQKT